MLDYTARCSLYNEQLDKANNGGLFDFFELHWFRCHAAMCKKCQALLNDRARKLLTAEDDGWDDDFFD